MLGWKYVDAAEETQKYKVGNFILETRRVVKSDNWDYEAVDEEQQVFKEEDIQFDSQDEDECEDLFSGTWTPQLAQKRRKNRIFDRTD